MMEKIYIARHGFRLNWINSTWKSATGTARDPPLAAYGETQAKELADYFLSLDEDDRPTAIFCSPYYRCLQTAQPTAKAFNLPIHIDHGISEWYSPVITDENLLHPRPGSAASLLPHFPEIDTSHWPNPIWYPSRRGESVAEVHARVDGFLERFVPLTEKHRKIDERRVLLVTHAATAIVLVRSLTGERELSIRVGCCSLSELDRDERAAEEGKVLGAWKALKVADGMHLKGGTSREWGFDDVEVERGRVVEDPGEEGTEHEQDIPVGPQLHLISNL